MYPYEGESFNMSRVCSCSHMLIYAFALIDIISQLGVHILPYLSLRKSTTRLKSSMQYSLFISISMLSEADCTGTWRKA